MNWYRPEPAGFSIAAPMVGHVVMGTVRSLVACTEKFALGVLVKVNCKLPLLNAAPPRTDWMGAGMLNAELVTPVNLLGGKGCGTVVTGAWLGGVRLVNLAVPATAVLVVVPPSVNVPVPTWATILAVLVRGLPN